MCKREKCCLFCHSIAIYNYKEPQATKSGLK